MNEINIRTTLKDYESGDEVEVDVSIDNLGIQIQPTNEQLKWGNEAEDGISAREVWVELFDGMLKVHAWDGTQEDPNVTFDVLEVPSGGV